MPVKPDHHSETHFL